MTSKGITAPSMGSDMTTELSVGISDSEHAEAINTPVVNRTVKKQRYEVLQIVVIGTLIINISLNVMNYNYGTTTVTGCVLLTMCYVFRQ
jgi:hypothetical protein